LCEVCVRLAQFCGALLQITQVSCGRSFTACLTSHGELFCWGRNSHGECGIGTVPPHGTAVVVLVEFTISVMNDPCVAGRCV
jgi:alpha-tubulin suppressor-like RCC1 family protein